VFEFHLLQSNAGNSELYQKSYKFWQNHWSKKETSQQGRGQAAVESFLFNDELCVITYKKEPVALFLMSFFKNNVLNRMLRSQFLNLQDSIITKIIENKKYESLCYYSNITVADSFIFEKSVCLKKLQLEMAINRFSYSETDSLIIQFYKDDDFIDIMSELKTEVISPELTKDLNFELVLINKKDLKNKNNKKESSVAKNLWSSYLTY